MNILGIGVDIVENSRIKKFIKNKKFLQRIYTNEELNKSKSIKNKISFFSKRFAAKEAFSKALGTGFRKGLHFKDISISNDKLGKPSIKINKKLKELVTKKFNIKKIKIYLSISDEKKYSTAFAIIQALWN